MMDDDVKKKITDRLRRIEGQIKGLGRMLEEDKYCIDILLQISAAEGALRQVSFILLKNHIETCVSEVVTSGNERDRTKKIEELVEVFSRFGGIHVEKQRILELEGPGA